MEPQTTGAIIEQHDRQLREARLAPERVAALLDRARKEVDDGLLPSAQVALAKDGKLVIQASFGEADDNSLICIFSATKAITASAAWLLFAEGLLAEDELVADIVPEFASNEKDQVMVGQLFSHTAGFPSAPFAPLDWIDKSRRYGRFTQWRLNWVPGSRFEYHPSSSMWVIAELIERRTGQTFTNFIQGRVLAPLGLSNLIVGLPAEANARTLPCVNIGTAMTPAEFREMGLPVPPVTEVTDETILAFNRPEVRAVGVPGGGGFGGAGDLALFYQGLLHGGLGDKRIWSDEVLADALRIRSGELIDPSFKKPANRTLGLVNSGDKSRNFRGFGKTNSAAAFGHNGAGGQLAWADPASGLSFVYLTPGHDRNVVRRGQRGVAISSLAAVCTG